MPTPSLLLLSLLLAFSGAAGDESDCAVARQAAGNLPKLLAEGEIHADLETVAEQRIRRGVALVHLDAPASLVWAVVTDDAAFSRVLPWVAESSLHRGATGTIVEQRLDLPFPLQDRHYQLAVERRAGSPCAESRWRYRPGSGNIEDTFGRWEVLSLDDGSSLLAYVIWVDPGGRIPAWAQNWASRRALPEVMEAVRSEVARRMATGTR